MIAASAALVGGSFAARRQCPPAWPPYFAFQVDAPATWVRDSTVSPHPDASRDVEAQELPALVQFLVDTTGRPVPESYKVLSARNPALAADGRAVLSRWRFTPASIRSCRVPQVVQTPLGR